MKKIKASGSSIATMILKLEELEKEEKEITNFAFATRGRQYGKSLSRKINYMRFAIERVKELDGHCACGCNKRNWGNCYIDEVERFRP